MTGTLVLLDAAELEATGAVALEAGGRRFSGRVEAVGVVGNFPIGNFPAVTVVLAVVFRVSTFWAAYSALRLYSFAFAWAAS